MPSPKTWLFSIKVYIAAMLALWVAFNAAVQYPYWAMMVVYILALPTTGAMRQKALYMVAGSTLGATLGVVSSAVFATSEIAQLISMALLASTAGFLALRDRLPSFYFFLLAALTCMLVALPGLTTPDQAFGRGVERVQDVVIGAACMLLVDLVVFPVLIGPQFITATDAWMAALKHATRVALRGDDLNEATHDLMGKAAAIDPIARQMRYEGQGFAWTRSRIGLAMRARALRLLPVLEGLPRSDAFTSLRQRFANELDYGLDAVDRRTLRAARGNPEARQLRLIAATWHRLRLDRKRLEAKRPRWIAMPPGEYAMPTTLAHRDWRYALRTSVAVLMFFAGMCTLWTLFDWPSTMAIGLLLGTVFLIISGQAEDPAPLLLHIFVVVLIAFFVDMTYLTVILPRVTTFITLAMVLSPALFVLGGMLLKPGGLLYAILPMALIRLGNTGPTATADTLIQFASGIAVGLTGALVLTLAFRRAHPLR